MRAVLLVAAAIIVLSVAPGAVPAAESSSPWAEYLAPPAACPGALRPGAASDAQRRALACMINWMRRRAGLRRLSWSSPLAQAAIAKAAVIASCGDFSHYPCGTRWPFVSTAERRYSIWGENLYFGPRWLGSPRAALLAWLESPPHRAVLLGRRWRDLGLDLLELPSLAGQPDVSLWVLEVAGRP